MTQQRRSTDHPDSKRARRKVVVVAVVAAVAVMLAFAAAGFALWLNAGRTQQIQDERAANILRSCQEQNQRHDAAIRALDQLIAKAQTTAGPAQVERMRQSRASTVLLIDALAPMRDCPALVTRQVDTK